MSRSASETDDRLFFLPIIGQIIVFITKKSLFLNVFPPKSK